MDTKQKEFTVRRHEAHSRQEEEALKNAREAQASWKKVRGSKALKDLVARMEFLVDYHTTIAMNAFGEDKDLHQLVRLTTEERMLHMNRAAGVDEVLAWLRLRMA